MDSKNIIDDIREDFKFNLEIHMKKEDGIVKCESGININVGNFAEREAVIHSLTKLFAAEPALHKLLGDAVKLYTLMKIMGSKEDTERLRSEGVTKVKF